MSGPEWTPEPSDDPVKDRPLNHADDGLISPAAPTVQVGPNPFGTVRARPVDPTDLAQDDAEAQAHLDEDETATESAHGPSKLGALVGLARVVAGGIVVTLGVVGATLARLRRRSQTSDAATDPRADSTEPEAPLADSAQDADAEPDTDVDVEPRAGRVWSPAGWAWETRVGVAAVFSFLILVGVLVVKKGWLGSANAPALAIAKDRKPGSTDADPDEAGASAAQTDAATPPASVDPVADASALPVEPMATDSPPDPILASNQPLRLGGGPAATANPAQVPPAPTSDRPLTLATGSAEPPGPSSLPTIDAGAFGAPTGEPLGEFAPPATTGGDGTNPPILPTMPVAPGEMPSLPADPSAEPDPADAPPTVAPSDPPALPDAPPTVAPSDPPALPDAPPTVAPSDPPALPDAPPTVDPAASVLPIAATAPLPAMPPPVAVPPSEPAPATEPTIMPMTEPVTPSPQPAPQPRPQPQPQPRPQPEPADLPPAPVELPPTSPFRPTTPRPAESPSLEQIPASAAAVAEGDSEPAASSRGEGWVVIPSAGKRPGAGASDDPGIGSGVGDDNLLGTRPKVADGPPIRDDLGAGAGQVGPVLHTVQPGENFWTISKQYYNSPRYYQALHQANAGQVPDIRKLYVGTVIRVPPPETLDRSLVTPPLIGAAVDGPAISRASTAETDGNDSIDPGTTPETAPMPGRSTRPGLRNARSALSARSEPAEAPRRPTYRVKPNDTLRSIARDTLRDSHRATEIYNLNRDSLADPRALPAPGTTLTLPTDAVIGPRLR